MGNTTVWKQHFDLLEETIDQLQLRDNPKAIFNCDESMIAMDRRSGTVVVSRKTKHTYSESKGTWEHITVNACVSTSSYIMPPNIIFSQSYPSGPYARDGPNGALYSIQSAATSNLTNNQQPPLNNNFLLQRKTKHPPTATHSNTLVATLESSLQIYIIHLSSQK